MKTVKTSGIENLNLVATFNSDPFAVENEDLMNEVMVTLGEYANQYDKDDEEFEELAEMLDGKTDTYEYILSNGNVTVGILK